MKAEARRVCVFNSVKHGSSPLSSVLFTNTTKVVLDKVSNSYLKGNLPFALRVLSLFWKTVAMLGKGYLKLFVLVKVCDYCIDGAEVLFTDTTIPFSVELDCKVKREQKPTLFKPLQLSLSNAKFCLIH